MRHSKEISGLTQDQLERDYISQMAWGHLGIPSEKLEFVAGAREFWAVRLRQLSPNGRNADGKRVKEKHLEKENLEKMLKAD